jgi:peptidylprolyl isomerase
LSVTPRHRARKKHGFFTGKVIALIVVVLVVVCAVVGYQLVSMGGSSGNVGLTRIVLVTSMGNITIELYGDTPITSGNFKNLTENGAYDGTIFHRVVAGFVIQGGDVSGKGIGVPMIADELPNKHSNVRGSVAMAKASDSSGTAVPNSASSQFFINLADNSYLDSSYVVFGRVVVGMNVADAIGNVAVDSNSKPVQDVRLIKALIIG